MVLIHQLCSRGSFRILRVSYESLRRNECLSRTRTGSIIMCAALHRGEATSAWAVVIAPASQLPFVTTNVSLSTERMQRISRTPPGQAAARRRPLEV
jgi:hypothetical protein